MALPRTCDGGVRVMHESVQLLYLMLHMHVRAENTHRSRTGPNEGASIGLVVGLDVGLVLRWPSGVSFLAFESQSLTS